MIMGQPEERGIGKIHRQIAVLPHPAGHQLQGGSTQLSNAQTTERHPLENPWCHSRRDQMADLGEYRPGGNESAGVFQAGTAKAGAAHDREDGPFSIGLMAAGFVVSRLRTK